MSTPAQILKEIAKIERMERGTLCRMREGRDGPYFNHQTWEGGRNVVRYVARDQAEAVQSAMEGYRQFLALTKAYADLIIQRTRAQAPALPPPRRKSRRP
jgi:hypothetical protein